MPPKGKDHANKNISKPAGTGITTAMEKWKNSLTRTQWATDLQKPYVISYHMALQ
jgi:hypothetical protein